MTTSTQTLTPQRSLATPARWAIGLAAAIGIASVANAIVAQAAIAAGADPSFGSFAIGATTGYSALGVLIGFTGWIAVRQWVPRAATVLAALVPTLTVLSFIPDLTFLDPASQEGAGPIAAIALMVMHVVVVAVAVPIYQRLAPVPPA